MPCRDPATRPVHIADDRAVTAGKRRDDRIDVPEPRLEHLLPLELIAVGVAFGVYVQWRDDQVPRLGPRLENLVVLVECEIVAVRKDDRIARVARATRPPDADIDIAPANRRQSRWTRPDVTRVVCDRLTTRDRCDHETESGNG